MCAPFKTGMHTSGKVPAKADVHSSRAAAKPAAAGLCQIGCNCRKDLPGIESELREEAKYRGEME